MLSSSKSWALLNLIFGRAFRDSLCISSKVAKGGSFVSLVIVAGGRDLQLRWLRLENSIVIRVKTTNKHRSVSGYIIVMQFSWEVWPQFRPFCWILANDTKLLSIPYNHVTRNHDEHDKRCHHIAKTLRNTFTLDQDFFIY